MKRTNKKESRGLPGGPNEQFTYVTGVFMQDIHHVPKAQLGNKGKREFIKKYKETDINRLKHYQDKNPKFRDLSVDELENFGVMEYLHLHLHKIYLQAEIEDLEFSGMMVMSMLKFLKAILYGKRFIKKIKRIINQKI